MSGVLGILPRQAAVNGGVFVDGAQLFCYEDTTTTKRAIYTTSALSVQHSNPLEADAYGRFPAFYVDPTGGPYKLVLAPAADADPPLAPLWTEDVIPTHTWISYPETEAEGGVTIVNDTYPVGNIYRYKSGSLLLDATNDWSEAIQAACNVALEDGTPVENPPASAWTSYGFYRCDSSITLSHGIRIYCAGELASVIFYGCDGFVAAAGTAFLRIERLHIVSAAYPKLYNGISIEGENGSQANHCEIRSCYFQGWANCINFEWTWSSTIEGVITQDCDTSVRMFGQCVENKIDNCFLIANTGTYVVKIEKDGSSFGEGNHINNSTLGNAQYGVWCNGHLSLNITNSVIDQITDVGLVLVDVQAFNMSSNWVYATNYGLQWSDLGVATRQGASLTSNFITTTAVDSRPIFIGSNNTGINIVGGTLTCAATTTPRCVYIQVTGCDDISLTGVHLTNASAAASVYVGSGSFRTVGCTGNDTIEYNTGAGDGYTGTLTQCTTAPTGRVMLSVQGDEVGVELPALSAASNKTIMPAEYRPTRAQLMTGVVTDNSVNSLSQITVGTDGVITLYTGVSATFTAANNKGAPAQFLRYRRS
jgi:hypothetical protein